MSDSTFKKLPMGIVELDDIIAFLRRHSDENDDPDLAIADYIWNLIQDEDTSDVVDVVLNFVPNAPVDEIQRMVQQRPTKQTELKIILTDRSKDTTLLNQLHESLPKNVPERPPPEITFLSGIAPHLPIEFIRHTLEVRHGNDYEKTLQYLLETCSEDIQSDVVEMKAAAKERQLQIKKENEVRMRMVDRYGDQIVRPIGDPSKKGKIKPRKPKVEQQSLVRFYDNKIVSRRGEKHVPEPTKEEWDGGSRGRVKSKGKRGKGWSS